MENNEQIDVRSYNIGESDYSQHDIQPYDIFKSYRDLNYWECDIVKRVLRKKFNSEEEKLRNKKLDLQKIQHIASYLLANFDEIYKLKK